MSNILLATPMMPPTPGGPATHAKKLFDHFGWTLFNFEKYKNFPSGIRHILAFFEIFQLSKRADIIFALDGFTVALPAVLVGRITGKKVILRIGGDFIYENFLHIKEADYESFYRSFNNNKKQMGWKLYFKYLVQKFVTQNCYGIIFNTNWQKKIFEEHYSLKDKKLFVIENPIEPISKEIYENEQLSPEFENAIQENKFIFTSITRDIPYKNLTRLKRVFSKLESTFTSPEGGGWEGALETTQGSWPSCLKRISYSRAYICASISDISPNTVLEALSLGIPVIMTKYCGLTEQLKDTGVVRLVDPFNEQDIQNAIIEMCDDVIYNQYMINIQKFNKEHSNQTWEKLYRQYQEIIN
jgi:glycosyltransferase involved in cell wall biosynthesis